MIESRRRRKGDYLLVATIIVLILTGLVTVYSVSPILSYRLLEHTSNNYFLRNQLIHIALGTVGFIVASRLHYTRWLKLLPLLLTVSAISVMLLLIPALAPLINGARRWIIIGPFSFQPAELFKLAVVVFMAAHFSGLTGDQLKDRSKTFWPALILLGLVGVSVMVLQKDLGTMMVIAGIVFAQFYASGVTLRYLGELAGIGLLAGIGSILMFSHRLERILTFLDPSRDLGESGYHLNQSLIAIGTGGLMGLGIGKSVQVYGYLPEVANDSIFALIAETFGFIGSVAIICLFVFLILRCLRVALRAPDRFSQLLVTGITFWLASQTLINITAMLGLIPLTGIPLPFLSYGGTSLVFIMVALGIVTNVSTHQQERGVDAYRSERRGDRRSPHTFARGRAGA